MKTPTLQPATLPHSSLCIYPNQYGEGIRVQPFHHAAGEGTCHNLDAHTLFISLAPRPVHLLHIQGGKTYTGLYEQGDMVITPANMPLFARWESEDQYLQVQLPVQFLARVAVETLGTDGDRLALLPAFRVRNPHLEAIALLLLTELQQDTSSSSLYLDSLANVLAVNVLRHHAATIPQIPAYEGGLAPRQLRQILDYIEAHLEHDLKLADLAQRLEMSQFHFGRLFKQSMGRSPHQYLLQQRVERAKQLLKQTDHLIVDIALECGFNSHSHLTKQFRQLTGMTPKTYRSS